MSKPEYQIECRYYAYKYWEECVNDAGLRMIFACIDEARMVKARFVKVHRNCGYKFRIVEITKKVVK